MHFNIGLYSYPKSGNTWVRNIVAQLFSVGKGDYAEYIPDIHQGQAVGKNLLKKDDNTYCLFKSHTNFNIKKIADDESCIEIYILRNPLDVFASYLNFISNNVTGSAPIKFEDVPSAKESGLLDHYFSSFLLFGQLQPGFYVQTGSYYDNVRYWIERSNSRTNTFIVKYEDMVSGDFSGLFEAFEAAGIERLLLIKAIEAIDQKKNGKFYWRMGSYYFEEFLSKWQIKEFSDTHQDVLNLSGYYRDYLTLIEKSC